MPPTGRQPPATMVAKASSRGSPTSVLSIKSSSYLGSMSNTERQTVLGMWQSEAAR